MKKSIRCTQNGARDRQRSIFGKSDPGIGPQFKKSWKQGEKSYQDQSVKFEMKGSKMINDQAEQQGGAHGADGCDH